MQERADRIGGRVTIGGKEGEGTELELTVPLHRSRKLFERRTF
jgi:signal transduction histidine kinase